MAKKVIATTGAPRPGGTYSQGFVAGPFVFTAGQGPFNPETGEIVGSTIEEQTRQTLANLAAVIADQGLTHADVVKVTVHLEDLDADFVGFDAAYREFFESAPFPARTTVGSRLDGIRVEIDWVAYRTQED